MNSYSFLAVPLKSTSDVDLVKPLTTYIDTVFNTSDDNKAEVAEAVQVRTLLNFSSLALIRCFHLLLCGQVRFFTKSGTIVLSQLSC